ncbi:PREDICTED: small glutamine-rich tetratricopeptide repeat-containing protein alpha-like [Branchiostoma belcheri]|uniref:Small glutamine-rich tetratricopeptide repeat-containing protein alpha-like n=1 Tax=Branchiostoma belcheri TaxID=7741 RepID=A0A6P4YYM2_BRABE|nr:PREDICTED: small glutamine-rich tetratricopeptide repeat-containing protein alpha-like [Branchiostoma belcheri]
MADLNLGKMVFAIIDFLNDQLHSGQLSGDAAESLEVAIQCLETAYGIEYKDAACAARLHTTPALYQLFLTHLRGQAQTDGVSPTRERPLQVKEETAAAPSGVLSEEDKAKAEQLKNEGNAHMKAERYQQAVDSYTSAITVNSNNAVYYCNRAAAYSKLLDHQKSLEDCQKAVEIDPTYSKAYGRLGMAYSNLNQHEKAKQSYQQALELDPDNQTYQSNLRLAEQKLREINLGGPGMGGPGPGLGGMGGMPGGLGGLGGMGGAGLGGMDLGGLLNNPMLMNMATQMMQNPQMQQMLGNLLGSGGAPTQAPSSGETPPGPGGLNMSEFLQAGQQMAQQIQQQNPELVEQLRTQMGRDPPDGSQDNPDGKTDEK